MIAARGLHILLALSLALMSCSGENDLNQKQTDSEMDISAEEHVSGETVPLITFVELGSVNCIPCRKMQPVMKNIEEKYRDQIEIIFYDVWQEDQKPKAKEYSIRLIPTQVFLDTDGKELFRHEGFFPEKEIDKFLETQGLVVGKG